jgi:hypothetical protein
MDPDRERPTGPLRGCAWPGCTHEPDARVEYVKRAKTEDLVLGWLPRDGVVLLCAAHVEELESTGTLIVSVMLLPIA